MNRRGATLLYLTVGIGMMAGLSYMITDSMLRITQSDIYVRSKVDQLSFHMQAVSMVRNSAIRDKVIQDQQPALHACLFGIGSNCTTLSGRSFEVRNASVSNINKEGGTNTVELKFNDDVNNGGCSGPDCRTTRTTEMTPSCSSSVRCESVQFLIRTSAGGVSGQPNRTKETALNFSYSPTRVGFNQVDYSCAVAGGFITDISFRNMSAQCAGMGPGDTCSGGMPFLGLTDSKLTVCTASIPDGSSCARGVASVGIGTGATKCN